MTDRLVFIENLTYFYGETKALDSLKLEIMENTITGVIGPNGSGKTTLFALLTGLIKSSPGAIRLKEHALVGALIEKPAFYNHLTTSQNLDIVCRIRKIRASRIDEVLADVGLLDQTETPFSNLSLGMKQKLAIASALIHDPSLLILDEPTNGLDPVAIRDIRDTILRLHKRGITILIASHVLQEIEALCTNIVILYYGDLIFHGTRDALLEQMNPVIDMYTEDIELLKTILNNCPLVVSMARSAKLNHLQVIAEKGVTTQSLNAFCFANGLTLSQIHISVSSFEEKVFKYLLRQ